MKKKYLLVLPILIVVSILPIYPLGNMNKSDPIDIHDPRIIKVEITKNQLNDILAVVRKEKWGNLYTFLFGSAINRKIVSIGEFKNLGAGSHVQGKLDKEIIVFMASDAEKKEVKGILYFFKVSDGKLIFDSTGIFHTDTETHNN